MTLRKFRPEWLESFLAVVEFGSFSEAAVQLHRSQSRVSTHVAQLEDAVGVLLIDRQRRPTVPTEAGSVMLAHARRVLQALSDAAYAFDTPGAEMQGTVVLGTHPSISATYIPALVSRLKTMAPGVRVDLAEQTTTQLGDSLRLQTIDLAVRAMVPASPGQFTAYIPLWHEDYVVLLRDEDMGGSEILSVGQSFLAHRELVIIARPGAYIDPEFATVFSRSGLVPRISGRTEEPATLIRLVREGVGVGLLNELAARAFAVPGVRAVPVSGVDEGRMVALCWDAARPMTDASRLVAHAILTHAVPEGLRSAHDDAGQPRAETDLDEMLRTATASALARSSQPR